MAERENTKLIGDQRNIVGSVNTYGPNRIGCGHLRVTVLQVEDHDIVARMAKEMLESEGWEVDTCSDRSAALEKILRT